LTADLARFASAFDATSLEELESRSSLGIREDCKYVVDAALLPQLAGALAPTHRALEIGETRAFAYDSVYFDTPGLVTYRDHLQRRRRRFKCRTRHYRDAGLCFFEVKLRDGRERTVKRKLAFDLDSHGLLTPEALAFLESALRSEYGRETPPALAPVLGTAFTRSTLVAATGGERVTFDAELSFVAGGRDAALLPGRVLVETKTRTGNGVADRALRRLGARPADACSKYCIGMALLRPELRRNRFSRVMRRHFEAALPLETPLAA
jgi:hypothetical protein